MNQAQWKWLRVLMVSALLLSGITVAANLSPAVQRGIIWLQAQVQADGSLGSETASIATPLQNRTETLQSLSLLANAPSALTTSVGADSEDNTEFLARRIVSLAAAGQDVGTLLPLIVSRQNSDGGFGGAPGHDSNPLDTAWALLALHAGGQTTPAPAAIGYLQAAQQADGSYLANQRADVYSSAYVLSALRLHAARYSLNGTIQPLVTYLMQQQSAPGSWGGSVFLTAVVYQAVHNFIPLEPTASALKNYLESTQLPDGSWGGDAYVTALVARALQLTGEIPANPALGLIQGRVIDSQSGQALANVDVALTGTASAAVTTGTDGVFAFRDLTAGSYNISLSLANYGQLTSTTTIRAGQKLDFGVMQLVKSLSATTGTVRGQIVDSLTRKPLSGATISIYGASNSTQSDAAGNFQLVNVAPGTITVDAFATGYRKVSGSSTLVAGGTMLFSPALTPVDKTDPTPDAQTTVSGVVLDAGSNQPLAGVLIKVSDANGVRNFTSLADGRFSVTSSFSAEARYEFTASGYRTAQTAIMFSGQTTVDLGQVRLGKPKEEKLLPDLAIISIDRKAAMTDSASLKLSGELVVTVKNIGTAEAAAGAKTLAFVDTNRNQTFDSGLDLPLGSAVLGSSLAIGQQQALRIPLQGSALFRDAPIHVWVDSDQAVIELNERNNLQSTAQYIEVRPDKKAFNPVSKWHWRGAAVISTPVVGPLTDTNGDGKFDQHDVPTVITVAANGIDNASGYLTALSGKDGQQLWQIRDNNLASESETHPAIGDLDGDGKPELVSQLHYGGVAVFNHDGSLKCKTPWPARPGYNNYGAITLADLDGDGKVEILARNTVLNHDCSRRMVLGADQWAMTIPAVADLDGDKKPEIILSTGSVYHADGTLYWTFQPTGHVAVADLNLDGQPEVIVVSTSGIVAYTASGQKIWGPVYIPGVYNVGSPTIADMDGDGLPEIGVAAASRYTVFGADGSIKWSTPIYDGSALTGSTVFDFDGDGSAEVVYFDENTLYVFDGKTGSTVFSTPNSSATASEYPVVADIDGDGHADLLVPSNYGATWGLRALVDVNNSWVNTRKIWNQYAYHITNVNEDGSIPKVEPNSWQEHNTYRLNARPGISATAVPDLTASYLRLDDQGGQQPSSVTVRVGNGGGLAVNSGVGVAFYNKAPSQGGILLGTSRVSQTLESGQYEDVRFSLTGSLKDIAELYVVADDDGTGKTSIADFDRGNNNVSMSLAALPGSFSLTVSTDKQSYPANSDVQITAPVANHGSFDGAVSVRWTIQTPNGETVSTLADQTASVSSNASQSVSVVWNTGIVLAGNYQVKAQLLDSNGQPYSEALANFSIVGGDRVMTGKISTDKQAYLPSDTVAVLSRVSNTSANVILQDLRVSTRVLNPDGSVRWQQQETLPQLLANSLKDYPYSIGLANAPSGTYAVNLTVTDAGGNLQASSNTQFTIQSTGATGAGLGGSVVIANKQVAVGDAAVFSLSVSNRGNATAVDVPLTLSIVEPGSQTVVGSIQLKATVNQGAVYQHGANWLTTGVVGKTYLAVLQATVGGKQITLGYDSFTLTGAPIKLAVTQQPTRGSRVLVLLNCHPNWWLEGVYDVLAHKSSCFTQRATYIDKLLTDRGIPHLITTNVEAFTQAFQGGRYNSYWVLGAIDPFAKPLMDELREAVNRGDTLLLDGGAAAWKNFELYEMTGTEYGGKLLFSKQQMQVNGPLFTPASLLTEGTPLRLKVTTGTVQATYPRALCYKVEDNNGDKDNASVVNYPAIVSNNYGLGRAMVMGFDLSGSLMHSTDPAWSGVLQSSLSYLVPELQTILPNGGYAPLTLQIQNQGQAVDLKVSSLLPPGVKFIGAVPAATLDANGQPNWSLHLDNNQSQVIQLYVAAPSVSGNAVIQTQVSTVRAGNTSPYGQYSTMLATTGIDTLGASVLSRMQNLPTVFLSERVQRELSVLRFKSGQKWLDKGFLGFAVADFADAAEHLRTIRSVDINAIRLDLDRILQEVEIRKAAAGQ